MNSPLNIILCKGRFAGPVSGSDETLIAYAMQLHALGRAVTVTLVQPHLDTDPYFLRLNEAGVPLSCVLQNSPLQGTLREFRRRLPHVPYRVGKLLRKTNYSLSAGYLGRCRDYLSDSGADLIHVLTPDPSVMTMIRAASDVGIPVLYQELGTPDYLPEMDFYYQRLVEVLPLCTQIAALSSTLARRFTEKFSCAMPVAVLPLSIDDVSHDLTPRIKRSDVVTFGFAARLEYGKGVLSLLEAFARLHRKFPGTCLKIAGAGPQEAEIAAQIEVYGLQDVCALAGVYSGPRQKAEFMRDLDVFVLPSLAEGTPNSIIEAMTHAVPSIATTVGGIPDVITEDAGLLIAPNDTDALCEAMEIMAKDAARRRDMGLASRRRYEEAFAPAQVLPVLWETYQRLAATKPR